MGDRMTPVGIQGDSGWDRGGKSQHLARSTGLTLSGMKRALGPRMRGCRGPRSMMVRPYWECVSILRGTGTNSEVQREKLRW